MGEAAVVSRRTLLRAAQIVALLLAGGGAWRVWDQGVLATGRGPAYEPWTTWQAAVGDEPLPLVRAAILAASPHNSQPWRFRLTPARIDLFADTGRNIGAIDPYLREMYIGLGCALENLLLAAAATGHACRLTLTPDASNPAHAARIDLGRGTAAFSELYAAIPRRHTDRGAYDRARPLLPETRRALGALGADDPGVRVFWYATEGERGRVGELTVRATEAIIADPQQAHDSARWLRHSWRAVQRYRDGLTVDAQGLPGVLRAAAKILPPLSRARADRFWLQATKETHVATAAAFGIIAVGDARDNAQRMRGGRLWQRMHLWATTQGLAMQPLNQLVERADREQALSVEPRFGNALRELIDSARWQALMPFRIGYPTGAALASPRRAVGDVVLP